MRVTSSLLSLKIKWVDPLDELLKGEWLTASPQPSFYSADSKGVISTDSAISELAGATIELAAPIIVREILASDCDQVIVHNGRSVDREDMWEVPDSTPADDLRLLQQSFEQVIARKNKGELQGADYHLTFPLSCMTK